MEAMLKQLRYKASVENAEVVVVVNVKYCEGGIPVIDTETYYVAVDALF